MKSECFKCEKEFEDTNYEKFGTSNAKRIFCNSCVNELYKPKKELPLLVVYLLSFFIALTMGVVWSWLFLF